MGDGTNETFFHVAKVNIQIAAAGRTPGLGHVLRKNVARANPFDEDCAQVPNQRCDEILRLQCIGRTDGSSFLAQRAKHAADNLRLPVEIDQTLLDQTRKLQVTVKLEHLRGLQRRLGRAAQRLAVNRPARRILCVDADLIARRMTAATRSFCTRLLWLSWCFPDHP